MSYIIIFFLLRYIKRPGQNRRMLGKHEDRPDSNFRVFNTFDEIRPETQEQVTDSQEGRVAALA